MKYSSILFKCYPKDIAIPVSSPVSVLGKESSSTE